MTPTKELLSKLFTDTYEGEAWHGPSLRAIINGVSATQATRDPGGNVHTIAEFVHHAAYWMKVVRHWLTGDDIVPDQTISWGPGGSDPEATWLQAKESLTSEYQALRLAIEAFPEDKLTDVAYEASGLTYYALVHGIINHNIYHAGQIMLLKKLQGNDG